MLFNWNIPWLIQIVYISTADQSGHKRCYVYSVYLFRCLVEYQTFHSPRKTTESVSTKGWLYCQVSFGQMCFYSFP